MDPNVFRDIAGRFATGVTVVTTNVDGQLHGMTANAFTTVSLDPLLILVCVDNNATCHAQLSSASHFGVNILGASQEDLSNLFAQRLLPEEPSDGRMFEVPFELDGHGVPLLRESLAYFSCRVHERLPGGDHGIFVGEVLAGAVRSDEDPLLFYSGRYAALSRS